MDTVGNPIDLLREELDNDDIQIKVNAFHRLPIIMGVINQDKIISELIPFIQKMLPTEEDEVLLAIAEEIPNFAKFLDLKQIMSIRPIMEFLLGSEETVVRESAVEGIKKIIAILSDDQVQKDIVPMVLQISSLDAFQWKVSACYLIRMCYPKAGKEKDKLRSLYFKLCDDETPIIKRTAAKEFGPLCLVIEKESVSNEMISYYTKFMNDSDSVRVTILPSLVQLAKLFQNTDLQKKIIQFIISAGEDKSWRVRNELSKIFPELIQNFSGQINELIPILANLIKDSETEVRLSALTGLNEILPKINIDKVSVVIINSLVSLDNESSHEVKALMGESFGLIAKSVGYTTFNSKLGKLMDALMKDEKAEVRLGIAKSMYNIFLSSDGTLINSVRSLLGTMQKDSQYRIRETVYQTLSKLGVQYGIDVFKSSIEPLFYNYITDTVASVREVGVSCLNILIQKFGPNWVTGSLIPQLRSVLQQGKTSYLTRMCCLESFCVCGKYLDAKQNKDAVLFGIVSCLSDKVANVRFFTIKQLPAIIGNFDKKEKDRIKETIQNLAKNDEDEDVKFFASKYLENNN